MSSSILTTITAALLLLLTAFAPPAQAATPAQVELGKVAGWTGETPSAYTLSGDYLISTFCFCTPADAAALRDSAYTEAHYFQFEYFNWHTNATYIVDHLCLETQRAWTSCLAPMPGDEVGVDWKGPVCRTWWNTLDTQSKYHDRDTLCYEPRRGDDSWRKDRIPARDTLRFNGQKRHLDQKGGQGPVLKGKAEAEDVCDGLCGVHAGMEALRDDDIAQCHVVHYEHLDDMCLDCA